MNWYFVFRVLHSIYLGVLLTFIFFYFTQYRPVKVHAVCAESSAKSVLKLGSEGDAYGVYKSLYEECSSQKPLIF